MVVGGLSSVALIMQSLAKHPAAEHVEAPALQVPGEPGDAPSLLCPELALGRWGHPAFTPSAARPGHLPRKRSGSTAQRT